MRYAANRQSTIVQPSSRITLENTKPDNRQRITSYIQNNPGTYLRRIARDLSLPMGLTQYHLNILQHQGKVKSVKFNMFRHYFLVDVNEVMQVALAFLVHETSRDVLTYLIQHSGASQVEIARYKQVSSPTISWCMTNLMSAGIVIGVRDGRLVKYYIQDAGFLIKIFQNYYPTVWNSIASNLAEEVFIRNASKEGANPVITS